MPDQTMGLLIYVAFFIGLIYLMIIRPQKKEKVRKEAIISSLQNGSKIVSFSGIHGTVSKINDDQGTIKLTVANGVDIIMEKAAVARVLNQGE